jgi:outer membrane immunogenic protein
MRKAFVSIASGAGLSVLGATLALAADLPLQAPPPPVAAPAPSSWTGFYVGANLGYSVGSEKAHDIFAASGGAGSFGESESFAVGPRGPVGGGQLGYNWQVSPHWILGLEADLDAAGQRDSVCPFECSLIVSQKLTWLSTVRGRVGYAQDGWLWYITGGGAFGRVNENVAFFSDFGPAVGNFSETRSGATAGVGVEAALGGHWTAKFEYLYVDLGTTSHTVTALAPGNPILSVESLTVQTPIVDHLFRIGVNYQFNGAPGDAAPLLSAGYLKAPPMRSAPYNWNGFYVGANAGYGIGVGRFSNTGGAPGNEQLTTSPTGALAGGQVGYNWMPMPYVVLGIEADGQWADQTHASCTIQCNAVANAVLASNALNLSEKIDWLSTVRGRIGYAHADWLYYATAGAAFAGVDENVAYLVNSATTAASFSQARTGFVAGAGVETTLGGNWSAKLEYLYADLGSWTHVTPQINFNLPPPNPLQPPEVIQEKLRDNIIRAGVNYHF